MTLFDQSSRRTPSAADLLALLATRHAEDVFVPECKTGSTWLGEAIRLDAWAMKRSWASPVTYGYEIKASRGDFLRDDKWQRYTAFCSDFYFVCPRELIQPEELPQDIGLLWASAGAKRLFTKRKAARRQVEIPRDLFVYLLMCRTIVSRESDDKTERERQIEFWERWLKDKELGLSLGHRVSKQLNERIRRVEDVEKQRNDELQAQVSGLQEIAGMLRDLGLDPQSALWRAKNRMREMLGEDGGLLASVRDARARLDWLEKRLSPEESAGALDVHG